MTKLLILLAISLTSVLVGTDIAMADAGGSLLTDVQNVLTGSLGTVVGLGVSLFGLWVWLAQQSAWGILTLIAGAAITAFPGLYKGLADGFKNAFSSSISSSGGREGAQGARGL